MFGDVNCRHSLTKAFCFVFVLTFFSAFDVPVFWPILLCYWLILFVSTMKRQIMHMIKYKYVPFTFGKQASSKSAYVFNIQLHLLSLFIFTLPIPPLVDQNISHLISVTMGRMQLLVMIQTLPGLNRSDMAFDSVDRLVFSFGGRF